MALLSKSSYSALIRELGPEHKVHDNINSYSYRARAKVNQAEKAVEPVVRPLLVAWMEGGRCRASRSHSAECFEGVRQRGCAR